MRQKAVDICYNQYMFSQKEDLELIQTLDKQRNNKCHFCEGKSKYTQPDKSTGYIIDVCEKHFTFRYMG